MIPAMAAAADAVQCPRDVKVLEQIATTITGWTASLDAAPHQLAGITFFEGKPEEKASLAPDSERAVKGKTLSTWTFVSSARATWVACRYAATNVILTRELKSVRQCSVSYDTRETIAGLPAIEKIDCK